MLSILHSDKYEETVKYSKFISFIFKVYSREEALKKINALKEKYPDASHYCFGYVIDNDIKSSDDGEPSKTAGSPILRQIIEKRLNYVLIVVIRFFGGVKLGVGPLTRTYAKMAREVIRKENIVSLIKGYEIRITFNYDVGRDIDYILANSRILGKEYGESIVYHALVSEDILNKLKKYKIEIIGEKYIEKE